MKVKIRREKIGTNTDRQRMVQQWSVRQGLNGVSMMFRDHKKEKKDEENKCLDEIDFLRRAGDRNPTWRSKKYKAF